MSDPKPALPQAAPVAAQAKPEPSHEPPHKPTGKRLNTPRVPGQVGGAAAATIASSAVLAGPLTPTASAAQYGCRLVRRRRRVADRLASARIQKFHQSCERCPSRIKRPHPQRNLQRRTKPAFQISSEIIPRAWCTTASEKSTALPNASLLRAVNTGEPQAFNQILMGGNTLLVDPQCGLAFDLEGTDSHALAIGTPPSVASREIADAAWKITGWRYAATWNFTQYGNEPLHAGRYRRAEYSQSVYRSSPCHAAKSVSRIYTRRFCRTLCFSVSVAALQFWRRPHRSVADHVRARRSIT